MHLSVFKVKEANG